MTALKEYQRLEASGLWRASPQDQRREVIASLGDATLTICDMKDRPLAHWSLAALERVNPRTRPAIYCPDGDPGETLELAEGEDQMTDAIERLRRAVERTRPRPGRLRLVSVLAVAGAVLAVLAIWLPGALTRHAIEVVPAVKRQEIGQQLLGRIERIAGRSCSTREARRILLRLARRTGVNRIVVLISGPADALVLPGGIVALNRSLIEAHEDPTIVAGFILRERVLAQEDDPLAALLRDGGPMAGIRLLTTGEVGQGALDRHAENLLERDHAAPDRTALAAVFAEAGIPYAPFAHAATPGTAAAALPAGDDSAARAAQPVLADRDWVQLQTLCGS